MTDKPKAKRKAPRAAKRTAEPEAPVDPVRGRPTTFTREIADQVCALLEEGYTLRQVSRQQGMPAESTVRSWASNDAGKGEEYEGFYAQYTRARHVGYHAMAEETLDIADDGRNDWIEREDGRVDYNGDAVARARLRVDTRKWFVSKALPKIYGDKTILTGGDEDDAPIKVETTDPKELARQIAFILAKGMKEAGNG